ncbi:MAG: YicC family protein [Pseudoramibacter sp. EUB1.1]|uniref:YicC family protein n=1 Tax=Candidatus Pseudoramibacter fermentans TaxID=2594427 RepID=A0A6L5GRD0_9FIRM|nr:YicC family protein [Candidatus Pseudoramibacter fermentans]
MKSMTGFGRADYRDENWNISVEIKTVNHRYRDYAIRMPSILNSVESKIKNEIGKTVARGRIDVFIQFENLSESQRQIVLDENLAKTYIDALNAIKALDPMMRDEIGVDLVAKFPDVIKTTEKVQNDDENWQMLQPVLAKALEQVAESRAQDAVAMADDMALRVENIETMMQKIAARAPEVLGAYRDNIHQKVTDFLEGSEIDEGRILTEVAVMADRLDITEELNRMNGHLKRMKALLQEETPVGRKFDFLVQEMNREINTIGSKASDLEIQDSVVDVKAEIEKIREQIQNIE